MNSIWDLSGKVAVVIGGASGLGRVIALGLAEAGADVVASSRSSDNTTETSRAIGRIGRRTLDQPCDVLKRASLEALCQRVEGELGPVDILFNCAGRTQRISTLDCPEGLWNTIFDVNLNGTLRGCQTFGRRMIARRAGRIINIASLSTFIAFHEVAPYGASKAAVGALTRSLAVEWAPFGVQVNAIAPGIFPTALNSSMLDSPRGHELTLRTPMRRFGEAAELVSTAIYLSLDQTSFTTGQIIAVDGGFLASGVNQ